VFENWDSFVNSLFSDPAPKAILSILFNKNENRMSRIAFGAGSGDAVLSQNAGFKRAS